MAEAVLEVVLQNLSSLIKNGLSLFLGVHEDLQSLASMLTTIKATLEDAEEKQFTESAIKDWLQKLKDAAYVLDDILDECATEALQYGDGSEGAGPSNKVQCFSFSSLNPKHVAFRYKIAKKMKKIRERLDEIAAEKSKFHLTGTVRERRTGVIDWRETTSNMDQPQVYGRDEDRDKIIDFFIREAFELEYLSVYPLIGIGGLGKTALAQLIFNHKRVIDHFELRIWVCVSEDFSLKRMIKAIIESGSGQACGDFELEPLQKKLSDYLQGKRYLLVLDDVWDEEQENWMQLRSLLTRGGKGASVLVTTRLQKVAAIMGTIPYPHDLSMLSPSDCWELFKRRAFGPYEEEKADLVVLGKEILEKCGGVPLAAISLGSLLRFEREVKEWINVKESQLWSLQGENSVMAVLRLSYLNLPINLRQCFAFCALFCKDERICKQFLIELWVGNGFISSNEMLDAEDIGNKVWNELYWRSFFQDIETDEYGKIKSFKMHDLVHDLAQSITEKECCVVDDNTIPSISEKMRHLSRYNSLKTYIAPQCSVESLKTYIAPQWRVNGISPHPLKCYNLRVLIFKDINKLSSSVGHLKYLRYLNLSYGEFKSLPESISELRNLQILKLDHCLFLQKLPNSLIRLKALQHLSLSGCKSLSSLPPHIGKLILLKTLSMYFVGKEKGFLLAELQNLNLRGELHIKNLERVKSVMDAEEAKMSSKHLDHLRLWWGRWGEYVGPQENVEQILEVLRPHDTHQLQTLHVEGYPGAYFPQWMSTPSLKDLKELTFYNCINCLHLPHLAKLASLKSLTISIMGHVTYLDEESCDGGEMEGFIALEFLLLHRLPNLISLSRDGRKNSFLHLSKLMIIECPKLLDLPCLPSLNDLHVRGECSQDLLSSIHKLHNLESLKFYNNKEVTCFPDGMLQNLNSLKELHIRSLSKLQLLTTGNIQLNAIQKLHIVECESFTSLTDEVLQGLHSLKELYISKCQKFHLSSGFQYLTCLEELVIEECPEVEGFNDASQRMTDEVLQGLHSLKTLSIWKCQKFHLSSGFQYLTCLEKLLIGECPEVKGFNEASQRMTALQSLTLCNLQNLSTLPAWLGNLSLLHELIISECPKLRCLPMSIQSLTGLKILRIYRCSELVKRCQKDTGEDWPKISHVQRLQIEDGQIYCIIEQGLCTTDYKRSSVDM